EIDSSRGNRKFDVGTVGEFTSALKDIWPTMHFCHCLQQKLDNFWMKIAPYQYLRSGSDEWHVTGWNVSVNINHTLWQYQTSELRKNASEGLGHWKVHKPNGRILQKRFDGRRIRRADNPHNIHLAVVHCLDRG